MILALFPFELIEELVHFFESLPGLVLEGVTRFGEYLLYGLETAINAVFLVLEEAVNFALSSMELLPSVPSPPGLINAINWFFPVGAIISIGAPLVVAYVTFLVFRFILVKLGVIG